MMFVGESALFCYNLLGTSLWLPGYACPCLRVQAGSDLRREGHALGCGHQAKRRVCLGQLGDVRL